LLKIFSSQSSDYELVFISANIDASLQGFY